MSLCQTKGSSCGACCGLFNIDYPYTKLKEILHNRTGSFIDNVDYSKRETVISYREEFEKKESAYPKKDVTIYNCPFLGYIEPSEKKIGCMIHPIKTGDPKSQNFSFYGASICQSYDCKNKERANSKNWETLFDSLNLNYIEYSQLAGDHILITSIEEFFIESGKTIESMFRDYFELLTKILLYKIMKESSHITSFEIDMDSNLENSKLQKLMEILQLSNDDNLYLDLEELKKKPIVQ